MEKKLEIALNAVEETYQDLVEIANGILKPTFDPIDSLINEIKFRISNLSIEMIRDYLLQLQLQAYGISDIKEKAAFKAELAEANQKERFAISFNSVDGSAAVKDKLATISVSSEIITETLYNLVSNLLKTKLDQLHRIISVLQSILMSRMQEAKFMNIGASAEVGGTVGNNGKTILHG